VNNYSNEELDNTAWTKINTENLNMSYVLAVIRTATRHTTLSWHVSHVSDVGSGVLSAVWTQSHSRRRHSVLWHTELKSAF